MNGGDADDPEEAQVFAERVGRAMYAQDRAAHLLGIELLAVAPGEARVAMTIREEMLNAFDIAHGGIVFALADSAFAYACNSRGEQAVALSCSISFARPARLGERVVAVAEQRSGGGRTAHYDVTIADAEGNPVAFFRGTSYGRRSQGA